MSDAAGSIQIVLSVNKANFSAAMDDAQRQLDKFKGKTGQVRSGLHGTVNDLQATSASLRLFEGRMDGSIRAAERFLTTIPGVSTALKAAFPLVGGIALASLFVHLGMEVDAFIKKSNGMANALRTGFSSVSDSLEVQNDQLTIQKDKIEAEIAVLEKKPVNGMAMALDDAKLSADKLADSLETDRKKIEDLMTTDSANWFERMFRGQGSNADVNGSIRSYLDQIQNLQYQYRDALHKDDTIGAATYKKQIRDKEVSAIGFSNSEIAKRRGTVTDLMSGQPVAYSYLYGNQGTNVANLNSFKSSMESRVDISDTDDQIQTDQKQKTKLQNAKNASATLKEAGRKQVATMLANHTAWQAVSDRSKQDEVGYWTSILAAQKTGSAGYLEATKQHNSALIELNHESVKDQKAFHALWFATAGPSRWNFATTSPQSSDVFTAGPATPKLNDLLPYSHRSTVAFNSFKQRAYQSGTISDQNGFSQRQAQTEIASTTGTISKHQEAMALAALHTDEYSAALNRLKDALEAIKNDSTLTTLEKSSRSLAVNNNIAELNGRRSVQMLNDNAVVNSSGLGGARDALIQFAQSVTNAGHVVGNFAMNVLQGFNSAVVGSSMGQHGTFRQFGRSVMGQGENAILQGTEGFGIKGINSLFGTHLSNGKMGTPGNPMYVKIADGMTSGVSGLLSGFGNSGIGKFFSSMLSGLPFLAGGGPINGPAIVGEKGPELFVPHSAGHIVPNYALGSSSQQISIDARGTNPAMVQSAVHRGMSAAYSASVKTSSHKQNDDARRRAG